MENLLETIKQKMLSILGFIYDVICASPAKVAATKSYGAKVILQGSGYEEAWIAAQEIAKKESRTIIHAFDDAQVIAGQGTIGLELLEDLPDLNQVYIPYHILPGLPCAIYQFQVVSREDIGKTVVTTIEYSVVSHLASTRFE